MQKKKKKKVNFPEVKKKIKRYSSGEYAYIYLFIY